MNKEKIDNEILDEYFDELLSYLKIITDIKWIDKLNAEFQIDNCLTKINCEYIIHDFIKFKYKNFKLDLEQGMKTLSRVPTIDQSLYDILELKPNGIILASSDEKIGKTYVYNYFYNNFKLKDEYNIKIVYKSLKYYIVYKKSITEDIIQEILDSIPNNGLNFND